MKIIKYDVIDVMQVQHFLDNGWQPWGSPIDQVSTDGNEQRIVQAMVKYEQPKKQRTVYYDHAGDEIVDPIIPMSAVSKIEIVEE